MANDIERCRARRRFLGASLAVPAAVFLAVFEDAAGQARATPACIPGGAPTDSQTEGPYFTPNSPLRTALVEPGSAGARVIVEGSVLTPECQPIPRALLDFWQADGRGEYDNAGYRFRGHQFTDEAGRYRLETVVPGIYPGRTRHIHVKVQAPGQPVLTTQLYFPGEPTNQRDGLFNPHLLMKTREGDGTTFASFDFVVGLRAPRRPPGT